MAIISWINNISASPFSPTDISGLVAWFDMQDAGSYSVDGSNFVTSLTNKASSVAWNTALSVLPGYSATGIGGTLPGLAFNGSNQGLVSSEAAVVSAFTNSAAYTLLYVVEFDVIDKAEAVIGVGNSGVATDSARQWGQSTNGSGRWISQTINDAGTTSNAIGTDQSINGPVVHCWHSPGTTVSLITESGSVSPNAAAQNPGTLTPNRVALGTRPDSNPDARHDGRIGELLVYTSELGSTDRNLLRQYLGTKWNVVVT